MLSHRWFTIPIAIVGFVLYGYDQVAAELYKLDLQKRLTSQVSDASRRLASLQPAEQVRIALDAARDRARAEGRTFAYTIRSAPDRVEARVSAPYRTAMSHYVGRPELPAEVTLTFGVAR